MSKKKIPSVKVIEDEYWYCERCEIDNLGERMCPCPRGSCDAEPIGVIKTTVEISITASKPITPIGDVEELNCNTCDAVTGHHIINNAWTCIHCDTRKR